MKKLLMVLMVSIMVFGCEEEATTTDSGSIDGGSGGSTPSPPIPYEGIPLSITDLPALNDSVYWGYTINGTPTVSSTITTALYNSSLLDNSVSVFSKFKILGNQADGGSYTISSSLFFPASSNRLAQSVYLRFGAGLNTGILQVTLTARSNNDLVYRLSYGDGNSTQDAAFDVHIASNSVDNLVNIIFTRNSLGVASVDVNGNLYSFSQAVFSEDVDIHGYISGTGIGAVLSLSLSPNSSFAQFQGGY
jgi:hypothetical protein